MLPSGETLPADLCVFGVGECVHVAALSCDHFPSSPPLPMYSCGAYHRLSQVLQTVNVKSGKVVVDELSEGVNGCVHEPSPSLPLSLPSLSPYLTPSLLPSLSLPPILLLFFTSLQHMKVADNVYAAGDIAQFSLHLTGDKVSIGHWQITHNHGRVAAMNMLEKRVSFNSVPFF